MRIIILSLVLSLIINTTISANNETIKSYKKLALQGDSEAQLSLGLIYDFGEKSIKENNNLAIKWYEKSAIQGNAEAQYFLGTMYYLGEGTKKNNALALKWYRKSAVQGDSYAQYSLASMYDNGYGVKENDTLAINWYKKSAIQGDKSAQLSLRDAYYEVAAKKNYSSVRGRNFTIQAGAFLSVNNARNLLNILKQKKINSFMVKNKKTTLYHVCIGSFATSIEAGKTKKHIEITNRNNKFYITTMK